MKKGLATHKAELVVKISFDLHVILCMQTITLKNKSPYWLEPVLNGAYKNADEDWDKVNCGNCKRMRG